MVSAVTVVRPCVDSLGSGFVSVEACTCCFGVKLMQNDAFVRLCDLLFPR